MKRKAAAIFLAFAISPAWAAGPTVESAIKAVEQRQAEAWNAHDAAAYAELFTTDAQVVNVLGWHWTGRVELKEKLGRAFASVFARSSLSIEETTVEVLAPGIAVAHVRWMMSGALSPTGQGGSAPEQGLQLQVLVKRAGTWQIADFQNTNSVPERPFPAPR